jgi:TRAP-type C4-dicarboxylate transport system permease small subunit
MTDPSIGTIQNLNERATLWFARAGSAGLAAMMFLTLFDVIGRAFGHPIAVSVEVTELIMGMMIYLGIGYTTFKRGHIRVDILITNMSARVQSVFDFITGSVGLLIGVLISWRLWIQAVSRYDNNDLTQIAEASVWPYAIIMAVACMLMVTSLLFHLYTTARMAFGIDEAVVPDNATLIE